MLARRGKEVAGIDPASASLDVARRKSCADRVRWLEGDASCLPPLGVDLVTMTGNVAQVFLADAEWVSTLTAARAALRPGGFLVFEVRDPARRAWEGWFGSDGTELTSDSTLRFREKDEIVCSLDAAGFQLREIRDAPDRPGLEWVFVAVRPHDGRHERTSDAGS